METNNIEMWNRLNESGIKLNEYSYNNNAGIICYLVEFSFSVNKNTMFHHQNSEYVLSLLLLEFIVLFVKFQPDVAKRNDERHTAYSINVRCFVRIVGRKCNCYVNFAALLLSSSHSPIQVFCKRVELFPSFISGVFCCCCCQVHKRAYSAQYANVAFYERGQELEIKSNEPTKEHSVKRNRKEIWQ